MKLRSFDLLYSVNNSITKTVKVRQSSCDSLLSEPLMIKRDTDGDSHCTYKSVYIPPNTSC